MAYDRTKDNYEQYPIEPTAQARKAAAVTPHDTNDLTVYAKALYIGTTGGLVVIPVGQDTSVTFVAHPVGYFVAVQVRRVLSTGTTADDIVALYD